MIRDGFEVSKSGVAIVIATGLFFLVMLAHGYGWIGVIIWIIGYPIFTVLAGRPAEEGGPCMWEKKKY